MSLAALVLSIPPAVLSVADLGDRIRKRRRAREIIDQAQRLKARQVTVYLIFPARTIQLHSLTPTSS